MTGLYRAFWLHVNYTPSPEQSLAHDAEAKTKLVIGGVRAGKSTWAAMELLKYAHIRDGLIWIIGPDYDQARAEATYMHSVLAGMGLVRKSSFPSQGACSFTLDWGSKIETVSTSQDIEHIATYAPDAIAIVEAGQQPYEVYEKCLERALEKDAPILISGTLEKNKYPWYAQKYREWQGYNEADAVSYSIPSWSNLSKFPGGRDDPKIKRMEAELSESKFLERCAAVPLKPSGLVFPDFEYSTHVRDLKVHPDVPVGLAVDPGYGGAYAVLFVQKIGFFYHVLSEVYERRATGRNVIALVKEHPLWGDVDHMVIDIAANQHHADDSQIEIWGELCPDLEIYANKVGILDGIEIISARLKVDDVIQAPLLQFSPDFCAEIDYDGGSLGTFAELESYMWGNRKPQAGERRKPIDANNHALKALGYYIAHFDGVGALYGVPRSRMIRRSYWK